MAPKAGDKLKALQERLAARHAVPPSDTESTSGPTDEIALAAAHFGGALGQITQGRVVQTLPLAQIAPETRPELRQPRLLPLPEELLSGTDAAEYALLRDELVALGESLRIRQIQPIVVYAGSSAHYPAARYLILVGQRRWTAAHLAGLATLDAIEVEPPTPIERLQLQFRENEDRADFSDMERAWLLQRLKDAMPDMPWQAVEERLHLSTARRQQLLRLLAFPPAQQRQIALLRLPETKLRVLHSALRGGEVTAEQAGTMIHHLAALIQTEPASVDSVLADAADSSETPEATIGGTKPPVTPTPVREATVAAMVERARQGEDVNLAEAALPRWYTPLRRHAGQLRAAIDRALREPMPISDDATAALITDVTQVVSHLQMLLAQLGHDRQANDVTQAHEHGPGS